jgi:hypothetical protein
MKKKHKYQMTMSLNVLKHLGIKLYSNIPAVLSEVVANAWDADAENVDIKIEKNKITVYDDGLGMTVQESNAKYLLVGYDRRSQKGEVITPKHKRRVMGRKGIGKLSLFSIAKTIEVHSMKDKEKHGFVMNADAIEKLLESQDNQVYYPKEIPVSKVLLKSQGTKIVIKDLKKGMKYVRTALRKRIARRFSIIGANTNFSVSIDGKLISIADRDYFHKVQYLWFFGKDGKKYIDYCAEKKLDHSEQRKNKINGYTVGGWIGSVGKSGDLKDGDDNLNKIVVMVRGKLAQEDILEDFAEGGLYTKYLIGEIHADFLDLDNKEDIATTNRQEIKKDDPRYEALRRWVGEELKHIQKCWTDLRNKGGTKVALQIPVVKEWFDKLKQPTKKKAEALFGKINQIALGSEAERRTLLKHGILAFESLMYKENLDALDKISPSNFKQLAEIFANLDDIEATMYHQIVKERIAVIKALHDKVQSNALEKVVQKHLYDHLWLLDPAWDRATETPLMEQQVKTAFVKINTKLKAAEKNARFDIKYKSSSGKHIIIELKRADRVVRTTELMEQVDKYRDALTKILESTNKSNEPIEIVCIVGKDLSDWSNPTKKEESIRSLAVKHIRVVLYQQLIEDAYRGYEAYLLKDKEAGKICKLIGDIEKISAKS